MAELSKSYDDGFKLTGESLETICSSLIERMKSESVADIVSAAFKLKYINDLTVDRPDIAAILKEENGGKQTIKALTIMLTGTKNGIKTASISLTFAAPHSRFHLLISTCFTTPIEHGFLTMLMIGEW